jgi:hypothetical protein
VSELVWCHVADPGGGGGPADGGVDAGLWERAPVFGEHQLAWLVAPLVTPLAQQGLHPWVQGDVSIGVELADGDVQPFGVADLHDRVDPEAQEFSFAQAGAGQDLDADAVEQSGQLAGGGQQFGRGGVVEEAGQWPVPEGDVAGEDGVAGRCVLIPPFEDPVEEAA